MLEAARKPHQKSTAYELRGVKIPRDDQIITAPIAAAIQSTRFEAREADAIPGIVKPGDVVLEIGAGIGFMSTLLARAPGVRQVIAVEANPSLMGYMAELHLANEVDGIKRINAVLTNGPEESATFYLRRDFWMGSLMAGPNPYEAALEVATRSFDGLLRDEGITLIVCDIEGAEAFLFDEADLSGVDRVFVELHDHVTGLRGVSSLFRTMDRHGFAYDPRHSSQACVLFQRVGETEVLRPYAG